MKLAGLFALAMTVSLFSADFAEAQRRRGYNDGGTVVVTHHSRRAYWPTTYPRYSSGYGYGYNTGRHYNRTSAVYHCSPEVANTNLAKADSAVAALISQPKFENETEFKAAMSHVAELKDNQEKMSAYLSLVDVKTPVEIAHFVGARDEEMKHYAVKLSQATKLPQALADDLAETLSTSLKGSLQ